MTEEIISPEPTFFQKLTGIFTDPVPVFHAIKRNPDWFRPFIVFAIIMALLGLGSLMFMDEGRIEELLLKRIDPRGEMSEKEQAKTLDAVMKWTKLSIKLSPIINVVTAFLAILLFSGIIYAVFVFFLDADLTFKHTLAVYCYSSLVYALKVLLSVILIFLRGSIINLEDPLITTDATLFLGSLIGKESIWYQVLKRIDAFGIWVLVLMIIGYAVVGKVSRKKSAIVMVIYYMVGAAIAIGLASLGMGN